MVAAVQSMMFKGETPWHGLGNKIEDSKKLSVSEAIEAAGMGWDVSLVKLITADKSDEVPAQAVYREINGKRHILGVVGHRWTPLQNSKSFEFFQPWLDNGLAEFHTAGALFQGETVWVLAKLALDNVEVAKGDEIVPYMLLSNSHDGTEAKRGLWLPLPLIGSLYSMSRGAGVSRQDQSNDAYQHMRRSLASAASDHPPLAWTGGHEHVLQVIESPEWGRVLVSGAGIFGHTSAVTDVPGFRSTAPRARATCASTGSPTGRAGSAWSRYRRDGSSREGFAKRLEFHGMVGRSPVMEDLFSLLRRLAPHARVALITGETCCMPILSSPWYSTPNAKSIHCSSSMKVPFTPVIIPTVTRGPRRLSR